MIQPNIKRNTSNRFYSITPSGKLAMEIHALKHKLNVLYAQLWTPGYPHSRYREITQEITQARIALKTLETQLFNLENAATAEME